jgi:ATP adenylyltransferase
VPDRQAPDDVDDGRGATGAPVDGGDAAGVAVDGGDATGAPVDGGDAAAAPVGGGGEDLAEIAPDGLMRLWMPHRLAYIKGENKPPDGGLTNCPFDEIPKMSDADGLIVARGELVYAVLNLYPYNSGHLMVVPYRHVADYTELTGAETAELAEFTKGSMTALRDALQAQGFNIGMNMGGVAGAGIAAHLHQHVVPRWGGDANFMPIVGHTKVLPQLLADTRAIVAAAWPSASSS